MPGKDRSFRARQHDAALEALERLQRQIEESRRRRRETSDAFDTFVRSFKDRRDRDREHERDASPALAPPQFRTRTRTSELPAREPSYPPAPPTDEERAAALGPAAAALPPSRAGTAGTAAAPSDDLDPAAEVPAPEPDWAQPGPARGAPRARDPRKPALAVAALVALLLFGWWMFRPRPAIAPSPAPVESPAAVPLDPPPQATPVAQRPAPPAELRTLRRVWMRVLVNGERTLEREVDAGTDIPFKPGTKVTVRAGDGGAVRLFVGGKDLGLLGADGIVVTRTIDVPPASP